MKFYQPGAEIHVPDGLPSPDALGRVTHLGIGAHHDDLEFMAFHGIAACYRREDLWFGGVTCTDGAGSARTGPYSNCSNAELRAIRREEQNLAARIGRFGAMIQLDHPSAAVKDPREHALRDDLIAVLRATRPDVVYTHNPADKHDTHIGVTVAALEAMRALPRAERPARVYGCEAWRNLDWMQDDEKVIQDVGGNDSLAATLAGVFDSQIAGGKRYDLAILGRRRANATMLNSHAVDGTDALAFAMDLTPLIADETLDILSYVQGFIDRFRADVTARLGSRLGVCR
ncbi:MAG: GlcNAc-PI de-N-acetylase [Rariglobus sp.]|nr:GlcNAc-PI de-N-acetylase [Rariglobus sp.]